MASRTSRRAKARPTKKRKPVATPPVDEGARLAEQLGVPQHVDTHTAAKLLAVKEQSLRRWASEGSGPIRPVKIGWALRWRLDDIRAVLNGNARPQPAPITPSAPVAA